MMHEVPVANVRRTSVQLQNPDAGMVSSEQRRLQAARVKAGTRERRGKTVRKFGWTSVEAPDAAKARVKFEKMHPIHQVRAVSSINDTEVAVPAGFEPATL